DDSLLEAADVLVGQGFRIIGLVTFPCEHSFTSTVAPGRPDAADIEEARKLGGQIAEKLGSGSAAMVEVPGNKPYIEYPHADWRPLVDKDACTNCLECADVCPVDAIPDDPSITDECCIVCHACVKACSAGARTINTAALSPVIGMLEGNFTARQEALLVV
ncbi:MAG: 4Fe-4S binding protein, partial [Coriobacteriaceae bacterium]|nr:4Fe-4S binding protein [Coriobacteriaceae bacterium]